MRAPSTRYPMMHSQNQDIGPDGWWIQDNAEKEVSNNGVDLSEGHCASNRYGNLSPFLHTCALRDKVPTVFHFRVWRRPAYMDEKEKQCPSGEPYRLRDVGSLILLGQENEVFVMYFGET